MMWIKALVMFLMFWDAFFLYAIFIKARTLCDGENRQFGIAILKMLGMTALFFIGLSFLIWG